MTHTVYTDHEGTEMEVYANNNNKVFIGIGDKNDSYNYQCTVLTRTDAEFLIKDLQRILNEFPVDDLIPEKK